MEMAADGGVEAMNSAEINPHEWELGKPGTGKPPARFDEGESRASGDRTGGSLLYESIRVDFRLAPNVRNKNQRVFISPKVWLSQSDKPFFFMSKKIVNTNKAPAVIGPFNQGIITGNLLFTSGQLPMHPQTGLVPPGIEAQTIQVLENLKAIIEAGGASLSDVVKTTVYLQHMSDFATVNKIYATYFTENAPARACVEVSKMAKESLVEIDAIAVLKS